MDKNAAGNPVRRFLRKIAPIATLTFGITDLVIALVLFDPSAQTPDGLAAMRFGFLSYLHAILIIQGVFALAVIFGGIWVADILKNVFRIVREGREATEAIQKERARALRESTPAKPVRRKKSRKARR